MSNPMENITSRLGGCNVAEASQTSASNPKRREEGVVHVRLADQQADPNSPLYSVKSFEELGLSRKLLMGLYAMPYTKPSKFQERALPLLINDPPKNMIGQSQSGTGKTATIVLTMLTRLNLGLEAPQAICLAPSRELACQIIDVLQEMGKFTGVTSTLAIRELLVRDAPIYSQVVIGTPGTVCGVIRRKQLSVEAIKILVLDEADEMLDSASLGDQGIRIKRCIPGNPQLVLFSATLPEHVRNFANQFASGANEISLRREDLSANAIKQFYMVCESDEHKYETLCNIYNLLTVSQSIIFCERRDTSDEIARRMIEQGHLVKSLHGTMLPDERDRLMDGFRRGIFKVLISTNVIARGIDIPQVSLVINYDLHFDKFHIIDFESYLHRIGRTGRFGRTGVSIILIDSKKAWDGMKRIERHFGKEIAHVPTDDWQNVENFFKGVI